MIVCAVIFGILLLFLLISLIRIGGEVEYSRSGINACLRVAWVRIPIYPPKASKKESEQKQRKEKKKKAEEDGQPEKKRGGTLTLLRELLPVVLEAVNALRRKIRVDQLVLRLTWAAKDPASAAMGYGAANAAMGMIYPLLDESFRIKSSEIGIDLDFQCSEPEIYVDAALTVTVGQLITLALRYGIKSIRIYVKQRGKDPQKTKTKEALTDERTETPDQ